MVAPELADQLPPAQRQVVTLRDVEGLPSADVCGILDALSRTRTTSPAGGQWP